MKDVGADVRNVWIFLVMFMASACFLSMTEGTSVASMPNEGLFSRAEYPRPDWVRRSLVSLEGEWEFAEDAKNMGEKSEWQGAGVLEEKITVPFCVESEASGIWRTEHAAVVWYKKRFTLNPVFTRNRRILLNFGAVDYEARVWLNGKFMGSHTGGYTPFQFDVTDALVAGENVLALRVYDPKDRGIPRGKQTVQEKPAGIFYTTVTGIWQPVYFESVGEAYLKKADVRSDLKSGDVEIRLDWGGVSKPEKIEATVLMTNGDVIRKEAEIGERTAQIIFSVKDPVPWFPRAPHLYPMVIRVTGAGGKAWDQIETYFAFRTMETRDQKILINGKPLCLQFLLNQGYYPRGHYTPVDPLQYRRDIDQGREIGYNGVRMHQKIESPRFLFWADVLGYMVWEEMPSVYEVSAKAQTALKTQWREAIERDRNHPAIITWVPLNENWGVVENGMRMKAGRKFAEEFYRYTKELDPTRPVVDNSGFEHVATDILDLHQYFRTIDETDRFYEMIRDPKNLEFDVMNANRKKDSTTPIPNYPLWPGVRYEGQPMMVSEYGGFGYYESANLPLIANYRSYTLSTARSDLFQGYCYTQQYDVEQEQNGLLTFDRKYKIPKDNLLDISREAQHLFLMREEYIY